MPVRKMTELLRSVAPQAQCSGREAGLGYEQIKLILSMAPHLDGADHAKQLVHALWIRGDTFTKDALERWHSYPALGAAMEGELIEGYRVLVAKGACLRVAASAKDVADVSIRCLDPGDKQDVDILQGAHENADLCSDVYELLPHGDEFEYEDGSVELKLLVHLEDACVSQSLTVLRKPPDTDVWQVLDGGSFVPCVTGSAAVVSQRY